MNYKKTFNNLFFGIEDRSYNNKQYGITNKRRFELHCNFYSD